SHGRDNKGNRAKVRANHNRGKTAADKARANSRAWNPAQATISNASTPCATCCDKWKKMPVSVANKGNKAKVTVREKAKNPAKVRILDASQAVVSPEGANREAGNPAEPKARPNACNRLYNKCNNAV